MYSYFSLCLSHLLGFILFEIVSSYSDITIQFPIRNNAEITKQVLEVDPELSPDKVDKVFEVQDNQLIVYWI